MMAQQNENYERSLPLEGSIQEAIKAFKGILDLFPDDIGTLESLFAACVQAGNKEDTLTYGVKLVEYLSEQGDWERVRRITGKILDMGIEDDRVDVLHQNALSMIGQQDKPGDETKPAVAPAKAPEAKPSHSLKRSLSGELDLAWMLLQNKVVTEEQYEKSIGALTETQSSSNANACICLLQELANIDRVHMDKVLGFLAAETNTPYIDIDRFEVDQGIAGLLKLDEARRYGVLPFAQMKDELMVGVLNPMDGALREQVKDYFDCPVHFFLCAPEAMQKVIDGLEANRKKNQ